MKLKEMSMRSSWWKGWWKVVREMSLVGMEDREVVSMNGDGYGGYEG